MSVAATETPMDVDKVLGRPLAENETPPSSLKKKVPAASSTADQSVLYSPELLQMYYSRLFPYSFLHTWLSYGSQDPTVFSRREFSFTLEPVPGEEIYIRYQSFRGQDDLQAAILKRRPTKIDLGAVFSHAPKDHNTLPKGVLKPVQRELVFDIDLTDYDEIRKCGCTGAKICPTCWGFMQMAVQVMDAGLKEDFGFQHVAWFYSGRRGIHAWVCDEAARALTDSGRAAVAHYFEVSLLVSTFARSSVLSLARLRPGSEGAWCRTNSRDGSISLFLFCLVHIASQHTGQSRHGQE
jgi:DNA primase small subunit